MSSQSISAALRRRVAETARFRCGYCLISQRIIGPQLEIDHIILAVNYWANERPMNDFGKDKVIMTTQTSQTITISVEELTSLLEPLMRRIVREELERLVAKASDIFYLEPDSPIYQDMEEILRRKEQGQIKLYSHEEAWNALFPERHYTPSV